MLFTKFYLFIGLFYFSYVSCQFTADKEKINRFKFNTSLKN